MGTIVRRFVVTVLVMGLGAHALDACSCFSLPLKRAFMASTEVFVGTTVDERGFMRKDQSVLAAQRQFFVPTVATMHIERRIFGNATETQEVVLDSCGGLPKGQSYLVFASSGEKGTIQNHGCLSLPVAGNEKAVRLVQRRARFWTLQRRFREWVRALFAN
jgi:hypothetical protein